MRYDPIMMMMVEDGPAKVQDAEPTSTLDEAIKKLTSLDSVEIKSVNGHYEAYENGKFICSGDTRSEVEAELREREASNE